MKQSHWKKLIAPLLIAIMLAAYYLILSALCLFLPGISIVLKLVIAAVPIALASVTVYVLLERIEEIRSGEEDDLSQY